MPTFTFNFQMFECGFKFSKFHSLFFNAEDSAHMATHSGAEASSCQRFFSRRSITWRRCAQLWSSRHKGTKGWAAFTAPERPRLPQSEFSRRVERRFDARRELLKCWRCEKFFLNCGRNSLRFTLRPLFFRKKNSKFKWKVHNILLLSLPPFFNKAGSWVRET